MSTWAQPQPGLHTNAVSRCEMGRAGPGWGAQSAGILIVTASLSRIPEGEHTFYVNMK